MPRGKPLVAFCKFWTFRREIDVLARHTSRKTSLDFRKIKILKLGIKLGIATATLFR